jgi:2-oxoglutarate ferredoxin oxidoreductase subunit beta
LETTTAVYQYQRPKSMTDKQMHYCPGCGHGILHKMLAEIVDELGIRERTIGIAPVGCSVVAYDYFDFDFCEAAHGRAPAVATGIKRSRPDCIVFAYQGDGDLASIGTAEIIHAANRGENYTTIFVNNAVYGMTGGQMAPTTMLGQRTQTTPHGRDPAQAGMPIKVCELLAALDAPYLLARTALDSPAGARKTKRLIKQGFVNQIEGKGFSLIEVLSSCATYWRMDPVKAMGFIKQKMTKVFPPGVYRDKSKEQAS